MIKILTDSCCDLPAELLKKHDIGVIDLQVNINNKTYFDSQLSQEELFNYVDKTGELPKTSARSVLDFNQFFAPYDEIIYIGIGQNFSATFQAAMLSAKENADKSIVLIDSMNLSSGIGLLLIKIAELRDQHFTLSEIEEKILKLRPKVKTSFAIDTLDYLHKGGRCSAMTAIVGAMLKIRPIIEVKSDGTMGVKVKIRGKRVKAIKKKLNKFDANLETIIQTYIFVTHTGDEDEAKSIKEAIIEIAPDSTVHITRAGSVISSHCGPHTYGILYMFK